MGVGGQGGEEEQGMSIEGALNIDKQVPRLFHLYYICIMAIKNSEGSSCLVFCDPNKMSGADFLGSVLPPYMTLAMVPAKSLL